MHIRILLITGLLALGLSAVADFKTVTEAYEVAVSDMRLPQHAGGTLTFRQCAECESQTLFATGRTRYVLNDRDVDLAELKKRLALLTNPRDKTATVMHHLESNTITAIWVRL
ncbi:MAG: hypothetical protein ACE5OQ_12855 [Woeseia sp.]